MALPALKEAPPKRLWRFPPREAPLGTGKAGSAAAPIGEDQSFMHFHAVRLY